MIFNSRLSFKFLLFARFWLKSIITNTRKNQVLYFDVELRDMRNIADFRTHSTKKYSIEYQTIIQIE